MPRKVATKPVEKYVIDTKVVCKECGKVEEISFLNCMRNGWPHCHNEGMHLDESKANIQEEIRKLMGFSHRNFSHSRRMEVMKKEMELRNDKSKRNTKKI